ncbi:MULTISPECIES: RDD family protein [unclassified Microbacterium]|uniref:RDD family protein n=1 Tax=unclassified Microbacterium TaxID=2609290 RepID=UPI00214B18E7|nr:MULTISPECIES: RDD family protein [unclassified Microbacterium]MCR2811343.1 RDD family protein [Microbacterium sp. zg.B185]WIM18339.1 RDD family protein [Microbacterium sp. zg-B185]
MTQPAAAQIAPISRRAIGFLIDAFIAAGLAIVLGGGLVVAATLAGGVEAMLTTLLIGGPILVLLLLAWFVVYTLMQAGAGSIGMRAQGLRLVSARDQAALGFGRTLLRNIIFGLTSSIVVGYFTPLFDGSGRFQGWHDKVAGSLMLDARATASAVSASDAAPATSAVTAPGRPVQPAQPAPAVAGIPPRPPQPAVPAPAPSGRTPAMAAPAQPAAPLTAPTRSRPGQTTPADEGPLIAFVPGITPASAHREAPAPTVAPEADSDLDATVLGYRATAPIAPVPPAVAPIAPVPPAVAPIAPVSPPVASATASEADAGETTVHAPEDTRISIPGHRLVFTWDDGTRVSVSRRTIFGRNPAPEDGAVVVPVRDETLSLSKTHFEAAAESSGGWVLDRHSTNGTTLVREGQRIACPAGQRVPVRLGDAIEIGDRIVTVGGYA